MHGNPLAQEFMAVTDLCISCTQLGPLVKVELEQNSVRGWVTLRNDAE
jgi:hypothetical protein